MTSAASFASGKVETSCKKTLAELDAFLAAKAYVNGFEPSDSDMLAFKCFTSAPDAKEFPYVQRWYKHIASFSDAERNRFSPLFILHKSQKWCYSNAGTNFRENKLKLTSNEMDSELNF